jgi:DnaJ family protein C protein 25
MYVIWRAKWVWRYWVKGQDYSEEDREYITRKRLKLSENHWKAMPEHKRSELLERELWVEANFNQYKTEQEDEMKTKLASSGKYKMYR